MSSEISKNTEDISCDMSFIRNINIVPEHFFRIVGKPRDGEKERFNIYRIDDYTLWNEIADVFEKIDNDKEHPLMLSSTDLAIQYTKTYIDGVYTGLFIPIKTNKISLEKFQDIRKDNYAHVKFNRTNTCDYIDPSVLAKQIRGLTADKQLVEFNDGYAINNAVVKEIYLSITGKKDRLHQHLSECLLHNSKLGKRGIDVYANTFEISFSLQGEYDAVLKRAEEIAKIARYDARKYLFLDRFKS